jgi:hypothetical protein
MTTRIPAKKKSGKGAGIRPPNSHEKKAKWAKKSY